MIFLETMRKLVLDLFKLQGFIARRFLYLINHNPIDYQEICKWKTKNRLLVLDT